MNGRHVADLLPAYLGGTLDAREKRRVEEHLEACAGCRSELASWEAVRGATATARERAPAPPAGVMEGALARIETEEAAVASATLRTRLSLAWQLLVGQLPLVRREIWLASALTIGLGCLVALTAKNPSAAGSTLAVFAPVAAAVGVAFLYGPENDPSLEVALSTPTPPRLVLLARLVLVYGYDLALTLGATAVLAAAEGSAGLLWPLISLWIGPMLFLSALALLLSLRLGPNAATLVALGLWTVKLLASGYPEAGPFMPVGAGLLDAFWQANLILLPLAALLFAATFLLAPKTERFAA